MSNIYDTSHRQTQRINWKIEATLIYPFSFNYQAFGCCLNHPWMIRASRKRMLSVIIKNIIEICYILEVSIYVCVCVCVCVVLGVELRGILPLSYIPSPFCFLFGSMVSLGC